MLGYARSFRSVQTCRDGCTEASGGGREGAWVSRALVVGRATLYKHIHTHSQTNNNYT